MSDVAGASRQDGRGEDHPRRHRARPGPALCGPRHRRLPQLAPRHTRAAVWSARGFGNDRSDSSRGSNIGHVPGRQRPDKYSSEQDNVVFPTTSWRVRDSNPRPTACKPPLFQLSYTPREPRLRAPNAPSTLPGLSIVGRGADEPTRSERWAAPVWCASVDARTFLGMQPDGDDLHWRMLVARQLTTPETSSSADAGSGGPRRAGGGSGRQTVWATGSTSPTHWSRKRCAGTSRSLRWVARSHRVVPSAEIGSRAILTVNAALGDKGDLELGGVWVTPPAVPPPDQCRPRFLPDLFRNTIMDSIEVRTARGLTFEEMDGTPGGPDSSLWARVPGRSQSLHGHPGHRGRLPLGGRLAAARSPCHGPEPRQHPAAWSA